MGIQNIIFILVLAAASFLAWRSARNILFNIRLGRDTGPAGDSARRWKQMFLVALGQKKMFSRPFPAILHFFIYAGFILINIEVIEMLVDGAAGTHRFLSFTGGFYLFLLNFFEVLAGLVTLGCIIFLLRRNVVRIKRFIMSDLDGWPRTDANLILTMEILLMSAYYLMNAADRSLQLAGNPHYSVDTGNLALSSFLVPMLSGMEQGTLVLLERFSWWFHVIGILAFINYLVVSKHLHIILSFPNVYLSSLFPKGKFSNLPSVTNEVKAMLDPSFTPPPAEPGKTQRFGAKDVTDLTQRQLLAAYTCTECGRCTSSCPANITGKKLSPRLIMMKVRDRMEEAGREMRKNGKPEENGKSLVGDYITPEELWACTSCNACVEECPVNIDPLGIIIDLRRFLVMEQSAAPAELNMMFTNIENNGAPWQFPASDRLGWSN